jgi:predicted AAA+ superfamily ATPase
MKNTPESMKRKIDDFLQQWKTSKVRQPLLVRGARQVGKTYSITAFGRAEFANVLAVNFEEHPELSNCFSDFDPKAIIDRLSVLTGTIIEPGKTLLFLDEIQECPKAITALRYFYEKMPELHVIGAGSLIEFTLHSGDFRMPVGRVQSIFMFPLTFDEFLLALNEDQFSDYLATVDLQTGIEPVFNARLETLLRQYLLVGGMPAAVRAFSDNIIMEEIQRLQAGLIRSYGDDFAKYASSAKHKYLKTVFHNAPRMVGQRYKYSHVDRNIESKFLKDALGMLCDARCLNRVVHTSGAGLPMAAGINRRKFKIIFLDVGLMQNGLGVQSSLVLDKSIMQINAGSVAEQLVGQELLANADPYSEPELFFWARDARGSSAEVDYLLATAGLTIPVEVKSGSTGSLKSMRLFLDKYPQTPMGIRYSMHELSYHNQILSIPLYMLSQTPRLLSMIRKDQHL